MDNETLTQIELSRAETGRRHYICDPTTYTQLAAGVDQTRGYPLGDPSPAVTLRGVPPVEELPVANNGSGKVLISLECWRFTEQDDIMIAPAIQAGLITELTHAEYSALLPTP